MVVGGLKTATIWGVSVAHCVALLWPKSAPSPSHRRLFLPPDSPRNPPEKNGFSTIRLSREIRLSATFFLSSLPQKAKPFYFLRKVDWSFWKWDELGKRETFFLIPPSPRKIFCTRKLFFKTSLNDSEKAV